MRRSAAVLVVSCILLAGCSGDGNGKGSSGSDFDDLGLEATEDTGVIRCIVVSESIMPLEGVAIILTGPSGTLNATSDTNGRCGFDGLEPGTYFLSASHPGYLPTQAAVEVEVADDQPDIVKLVLLLDLTNRPYHGEFVLEGFISFSARVSITAYPTGNFGPNDVTFVEYDLDRVPDYVQSEMTWKSTQALGDALSLVSECFSGDVDDPDPCPDGNLVVNRSEGSAPLIIGVDKPLAEQFRVGDGAPHRLRVFSAGREDTDVIDEDSINRQLNDTSGGQVECLEWPPGTNDGCFRFTGVGVIAQQQFRVFTTVFYGYTPPEGWTFIATGKAPQPE